MGFTLYGPYHLSWLTLTLMIVILVSVYFKKADATRRKVLQKQLAWFLLTFEIVKDIYLIVHNEFTVSYLPFELCSLAIFAILYHAYTDNEIVGELLYNIFLPGGIAALLFCNWTHRPINSFMCSFSFIFHLVLVLYCVMVLYAKVVKPDKNRIWYSCSFLVVAGTFNYSLNQVLGTNFMFLSTPSPGSPLVPLEQLFGNPGYIIGLAILIGSVWTILYIPWNKLFQIKSYTCSNSNE